MTLKRISSITLSRRKMGNESDKRNVTPDAIAPFLLFLAANTKALNKLALLRHSDSPISQ